MYSIRKIPGVGADGMSYMGKQRCEYKGTQRFGLSNIFHFKEHKDLITLLNFL
jgi:hypothetical protein